MTNAYERLATGRIGRRGLLQLGSALLLVGWIGTGMLTEFVGTGPFGPIGTVIALWVGLFGLIGAVAVTRCPRHVVFSKPILVWVGLNTFGFAVTWAAWSGLLPGGLVQYAYWHVWVATAVIGFAVTGELLRRNGIDGRVYYTAAAAELGLLIVGLLAFELLRPHQYLLLAVVHASPLLLDSFDLDLGRRIVDLQAGIYVVAAAPVVLV